MVKEILWKYFCTEVKNLIFLYLTLVHGLNISLSTLLPYWQT